MIGIQHVEISNRDAKFSFDLVRNITVIRGNSGTGKTTLFDMVSDYSRLAEKSGVNVSCNKKCVALTDSDWSHQLSQIKDSIVFIDEGAKYIRTVEFSQAIKASDNYYVIFSRESLPNLPYSVEEIYEIKTSGKYHSFKKIYKATDSHFYIKNNKLTGKEDVVLTEDSNSGYQFFDAYFSTTECISAKSNSSIFNWLNENKDKKILVIADGAAFGSQVDKVMKIQGIIDFQLCLPESFEWLILKSGLIKDKEIDKILENPSEYIESSEKFSWEDYFSSCLIEKTLGTPFAYNKSQINPVYLDGTNPEKIMAEIKEK